MALLSYCMQLATCGPWKFFLFALVCLLFVRVVAFALGPRLASAPLSAALLNLAVLVGMRKERGFSKRISASRPPYYMK